MASHDPAFPGDRNIRIPSELIRAQLKRILLSRTFAQAPVLSRLLEHLVKRTVDGQTSDLKEYSLGIEVFNRGQAFDPGTDTIVRVQARRLRSKLRDYYTTEGLSDQIIIELPKGHYIVTFRASPAAENIRQMAAAAKRVIPGESPKPGSDEVTGTSTPSIVVLPFANLSGQPENEYLADGFTEEIISALASLPGLGVVARTSAFQFKGKGGDVRKIGRELGVLTALEGSVRSEGQRIRVAAQLINVTDGLHLWSQMFERELTGVFKIQEEITNAIVTALRIRLTPDRKDMLHPSGTTSVGCYEMYLKGRYFYHKLSLDAIRKSIECMERAIDLDPGYAAAYAGLAGSHIMLMTLASEQPPWELLPKARRAAQRALELDQYSAEAHCSMGEVLAVGDWDFDRAEQRFRRALELKPSFVHAQLLYAVGCLVPSRRYDEALALLRQVLRSDPVSVLLRTMLGQTLILAGTPDAAIEELRQGLALEPGYVAGTFTLAWAYLAKSRYLDAVRVLQGIPGDDAESINYAGHLGYAHARLGNRIEAERILQRLLNRPWVPAVDAAAVYNALGHTDAALEWIEKARQLRLWDSLVVGDDPRFANLRSHPGFPAR